MKRNLVKFGPLLFVLFILVGCLLLQMEAKKSQYQLDPDVGRSSVTFQLPTNLPHDITFESGSQTGSGDVSYP